MEKKTVIGWIGGILIYVFLLILMPAPTCNDGWKSSSIGKRGACSWHHGVNNHGLLHLLAVITSIFSGVLIARANSGELKEDLKNYRERNIIRKPPNKYSSIFGGYKKDTPKEVILQLMIISDDPLLLVDEACKRFDLSEEEVIKIAKLAKNLKDNT